MSGIMAVSPEIINIIVSHLAPESVVAFALTCRGFYQQQMPSSLHLEEQQKSTLLLWLEQDIPHLYFCHRCNRLHVWRPRFVCDGHVARFDGDCRVFWQDPRAFDAWYDLGFYAARLVLNRHLYGEAHGPALEETLNLSDDIPSFDEDGVRIKRAWEARIIDNELFLHATIQIYHDRGCAHSLRSHLDHPACFTTHTACHHVGLVKASMVSYKSRLPELDRDSGSPALFAPLSGQLKSCRVCYTDYRVDIKQHCASNGTASPNWVIVIQRWHQLGQCRSPKDGKWDNLVAWPCRKVLLPRIDVCEAGTVYWKWMIHDGEASASDREGAEKVRLGAQFAEPPAKEPWRLVDKIGTSLTFAIMLLNLA